MSSYDYEYKSGKRLEVGDEIEIDEVVYIINKVDGRRFHVTICDNAPSRSLTVLTIHPDTFVKVYK